MTWNNIGAMVQTLRERRQWSREQLAEKASARLADVEWLEHGQVDNPSVLRGVLAALGYAVVVSMEESRKGVKKDEGKS